MCGEIVFVYKLIFSIFYHSKYMIYCFTVANKWFDPKTTGGYLFSKKSAKPFFFVNFNIIISHIFFKNFIEICSSFANVLTKFSDNISYFHHFSSIFSIFWHFLLTKKLMTSAGNRLCHHFFIFNIF